jgi:hypothetical protein
MERPCAEGAIPKQDNRDRILPRHLQCQGNAGCDTDIAAHHGVRAKKTIGRVCDMPPATLALVGATRPAQQLRHEPAGIHAARDGRPDRAATRQKLILRPKG